MPAGKKRAFGVKAEGFGVDSQSFGDSRVALGCPQPSPLLLCLLLLVLLPLGAGRLGTAGDLLVLEVGEKKRWRESTGLPKALNYPKQALFPLKGGN